MKKVLPLVYSLMALGACSESPWSGGVVSADEHRIGGKTAADVFASTVVAELARAACNGDEVEVSAVLAAGANPNAQGYQGVTPLIWATQCQSAVGMRALLEAGADPNVRFGITTPVLMAAASGDPEILRLMLAHGGDANARDVGGWNALETAFSFGMQQRGWDNYYTLLAHGADVNARNGSTIAEFAAAMNQYDKVADLLDRGYSVNLPALALLVQDADIETVPASQVPWIGIVRAKLEQEGVHFPVAPAGERTRIEPNRQ